MLWKSKYILYTILAIELLLNGLIIYRIPYTEIDYSTYMQQVRLFLNGERNYAKIYGDTGPLVYPAGFLYIYSLFEIANVSILGVQCIFGLIYLINMYIVLQLYLLSSINIPVIVLLFSKRIHSIYVLRAFNDPIEMLFLYLSIWLLLKSKYSVASIVYSIALSIKMNALLFFPGFGLILWKSVGAFKTLYLLSLMLFVQFILGYPFLITYPDSYFNRAFDFKREFLYKWTVNWKMVPIEVFSSKSFSSVLLLSHCIFLYLFLRIWCNKNIISSFFKGFYSKSDLQIDDKLFILFTSNFIGIVFARSLHYQFYSWYFHAIPYLLWRLQFVDNKALDYILKIMVLICIEICWNVYPSTAVSSAILFICHFMILVGLLTVKMQQTKTKAL